MARLAGSASLVLVDGATPLRPEPALFDAMIAGWCRQHSARRLSPTITRASASNQLPGRRSALVHLASNLPAAMLAQALGLSAGTAVRWSGAAGADWANYAAQFLRSASTAD